MARPQTAMLRILPGEIRNMIYAECLVTEVAIPLENLRVDKSHWPAALQLDLVPSLLRTCKQIYEEAVPFLYGCNIFYQEIHTSWKFERSELWRRCFELYEEDLTRCLSIEHHEGAHSTKDDAWSSMVARMRKLQVSIRPYSYLEWRFRRPSAVSPNIRCLHIANTALPPCLDLDILCIRVLQRFLMTSADTLRYGSWTEVALGYETDDAKKWRKSVKYDMHQHVRQLLQYGDHNANTVVLSGRDYGPFIDRDVSARLPSCVRSLIRTGYLVSPRLPVVKPKLVQPPYMVRETMLALSRRCSELVICPSSEHIVSQNIYT